MASVADADPTRFIIGAAIGCTHILMPVLGFLETIASVQEPRDPVLLVLIVLLALLVLIAYLRRAIDVFALCVAADGYRYRSGTVTPELELELELERAATALSPAAVLGWIGNLAIKLVLALAFVIFGVVLYMVGNVMLASGN